MQPARFHRGTLPYGANTGDMGLSWQFFCWPPCATSMLMAPQECDVIWLPQILTVSTPCVAVTFGIKSPNWDKKDPCMLQISM